MDIGCVMETQNKYYFNNTYRFTGNYCFDFDLSYQFLIILRHPISNTDLGLFCGFGFSNNY